MYPFEFCIKMSKYSLGTNKYASQKGMRFGGMRRGADIRADKISQESQAVLHLQSGESKKVFSYFISFRFHA